MDGVYHQREDWIDELARVLGIAVGEQLHRPLEVGKQHSYVLALAFESRLGGEYLLGEVLRGIRIGRRKLTRRCARLEASATLTAELLSRRIAGTTVPAQDREAGAAFAAEFQFGGVLLTALRAQHKSASGEPNY
jgi:hypothetical protein